MNQIVPDRTGVVDAHSERPTRGQRKISRHTQSAMFGNGESVWSSASLQPLHDRVLVRRFAAEAKSGSIIIPEAARAKALRGVVLAVGPGKKDNDGIFRETMVKAGDEVLFSVSVDVPYADLVHDGDLVMMAEADILGILRGE